MPPRYGAYHAFGGTVHVILIALTSLAFAYLRAIREEERRMQQWVFHAIWSEYIEDYEVRNNGQVPPSVRVHWDMQMEGNELPVTLIPQNVNAVDPKYLIDLMQNVGPRELIYIPTDAELEWLEQSRSRYLVAEVVMRQIVELHHPDKELEQSIRVMFVDPDWIESAMQADRIDVAPMLYGGRTSMLYHIITASTM